MELKEIKIPIIPSEYKKLEKMAKRRNKTVEEFVFDIINTNAYLLVPWWLWVIVSLIIAFLLPYALSK